VGSNAVVVKEVPAGATAVGNPARLILAGEEPAVETFGGLPAKPAFSAYGLVQGEDPLVTAMHGLIDHAAAQQQEIERLRTALERHGIALTEGEVPHAAVDAAGLNRLVEE
jgi:serine O-acetyltransferase